jgi:microcin C transport system permease protein
MATYILRRLFLMLPTLIGITLLSFAIINLAPGSPVDQKLQQIRMGGAMGGGSGGGGGLGGRGETGVSKEVIAALNKQYGFTDENGNPRSVLARYKTWIVNLAHLDFGDSFKYEEPVTSVILSKMPVSLMFGITAMILSYLICIPLGVIKAIRAGSKFDMLSSFVLFVLYSIPALIAGILLRTFLAGQSFYPIFPLGNLVSDNYADLSFWSQLFDRVKHAVLPLVCYMLGSFTFLTIMMQNSMLDVVKLDYVRTARAKGVPEKLVYLKHALRNALIPIVTGMGGILSVMFAGSIIVESIFSLDGMGLLSITSANARDYNVLMGLVFFQSLLFLAGRLLTDILFVIVDPRIDFT